MGFWLVGGVKGSSLNSKVKFWERLEKCKKIIHGCG